MTKKLRTDALQGLQGTTRANRWGTCLVSGYSVIFASDLAHQEPTQGGLIGH
jgi:hypothetical protein